MQITGIKIISRNVYNSLSILQEKCFQYWPSEGSVTHGDINVEIKNDNLLDAISVRDFIVTYNQVWFLNCIRFFFFFTFEGIYKYNYVT